MSLECKILNGIPSSWHRNGIRPGQTDVIIAVPPFRPEDLGLPFCLDSFKQRGWPFISWVRTWLVQATEWLRPDGHFYVYGLPAWLPHFLEPLQELLDFKYWISIKTEMKSRRLKLKAEHMGLVMFAGRNSTFRCNQVRYPHPYCQACGRTQKDYGGRSHLLNPAGCLISDIWKDLGLGQVDEDIPPEVMERILEMPDAKGKGSALILRPSGKNSLRVPHPNQLELPFEGVGKIKRSVLNKVLEGDIVNLLRELPGNSIDLAFADPPYNLQKEYSDYSDDQAQEKYLNWCESWLAEYRRVLKPGGALYAVNLPKWSIYLARYLSKHLHLQNWIAWDSLSEPRGKIMPAHYSLLYLTKGPVPNTFNHRGLESGPDEVQPPNAPVYCLRKSCQNKRHKDGDELSVELSDIWTDVHRIRHKRDRDHHPCQLPDALLDRIIRLSTRQGDVILDGLVGAGTTALAAKRLGRNFIAMEIDDYYVKLTQKKLDELETFGEIQKTKTNRGKKPSISKRHLQLELVRLAEELGREPTLEDIDRHSQHPLELYREKFPNWSQAYRAVRVAAAGK